MPAIDRSLSDCRYNAKPDYIRSNWGIVEEKVYPMKYDEAIEVASLHFVSRAGAGAGAGATRSRTA